MAGGGIKPGFSWGATDELGYSVVENKVHVHDLHATMPVRHRPQTTDLQISGSRLPPDGCAWQSCQGNPDLIATHRESSGQTAKAGNTFNGKAPANKEIAEA